jgi:predicted RND superfamily exporter protein
MEAYLRFVERYPKAIIAVLMLITAFFASQLPFLTNDSNPYLLKADHPARHGILELQRRFTGTYDAVLVAVENPKGVFNPATLAALHAFNAEAKRFMLAEQSDADQLGALAERYGGAVAAKAQAILAEGLTQNDYFAAVELGKAAQDLPLSHDERAFLDYLPFRLNPIKKTAGMSATENILARDGVLVVRPSLQTPAAPPDRVRSEVMGNEMMLNGVVAPDERISMAVVELGVKQEDAEGQLRAYRAFQAMVGNYRKAHPEFTDAVHIAGVPIFIAEQKKLMDQDMATLFPLVVVIISVVLIVYFRRPLGFLLPMLNVIMCTVWTLGMMSVLKVPIDIITSALPVFLITICGADAIHMMNEYYTQRATGLSPKMASRQALRLMISPVVLTTVTTIAGFLVATSTNISSIKSFGLFMAIGLATAQLISLMLIPAWLSLTRDRTGTARAGAVEDETGGWLGDFLYRTFAWLLPRRAYLLAGLAVLLGLAALQATRLQVEDAGAQYFPPDNEFRQSDEFVNARLAGTSPGWIEIRGKRPQAMQTTEMVEFIGKLDRFLENQPHITYTYSLAKYVKRMNLVLHDMEPAYNRLPRTVEWLPVDTGQDFKVYEPVEGDDIVKQSVLMYENGGGQDLTNVLNPEGSAAVTMFTMNTTLASEYKKFLAEFADWLKIHKPDDVSVEVNGTPVIWSGVLDEIIQGQVLSVALALSTVALVLMLWLRSVRLGLLAALPLAATVVCYYALMATVGIALNIGTAIISFLVVGIVDYSVHFLHRIRHAQDHEPTLDAAVLDALRHSGKSIAFNVLLFSFGFLALLASKFTPIFHLGVLVTLALSLSGFFSLFLIAMLAPWFIPAPPNAEEIPHGKTPLQERRMPKRSGIGRA